ncbi:MAG: addiction module protein [Candidatus Methylacidiphilales bacterium]
MNTLALRKKLHNYIDSIEQEKLEAIYTVLKNEIEVDSLLTLEQKKELDSRLDEYMNEKGKSYSWNEALNIIKPNLV